MSEQIVNFTVVADAVTIQTGEIDPATRRPVVQRATKGQSFDAPVDHPSVVVLRQMKSIRPTADVTGKEHISARTIFIAFRDPEDEVATVSAVEPIDAPKDVDPLREETLVAPTV